jgi:hypothetical protein
MSSGTSSALALALSAWSFWGIQDEQGLVWQSGWLGGIFGILVFYFCAISVSRILDILRAEADGAGL